MKDNKLFNAVEKLKASLDLTDEEYRKKIFSINDEESIDDLDFSKKDYDIKDCVVF